MNLILLHNNSADSKNGDKELLSFATSCEPFAGIIFAGLRENCSFAGGNIAIAIPKAWHKESSPDNRQIIYYDDMIPIGGRTTRQGKWFVVYNGNYITNIDSSLLNTVLDDDTCSMITVNVNPALSSYRENVRVASNGGIAGFRRFYSDSVLPQPTPLNWPHILFIRPELFDKISENKKLSSNFLDFFAACSSLKIKCKSLQLGGNIVSLETQAGLLALLGAKLHSIHQHQHNSNAYKCTMSPSAKIFGKVVLGNNVRIDDNAVIVGPAILSNNVKISEAAVIRASVIGPDLSIPKAHFIQNSIILTAESQHRQAVENSNIPVQLSSLNFIVNRAAKSNYRIWPKFSYAGCTKRVVDIVAALAVLTLFGPIFPVIALVIKLNYPGTVFFKDRRQGLHGKEFNCLKFRTMIAGADKIQEKLRFKNQVDGPQFKMKKDPRITIVGKFLRDTFIDEIPQFINILLGQMSLVGPRPSPKAENSSNPAWRDARLSVRPGITGLWQIERTRREGHDFQEWIYYDTQYVRNLSLSFDLLICWKTVKKLFVNFFDQF